MVAPAAGFFFVSPSDMSTESFSDMTAVGLVAAVVTPIVGVMVWSFRHLIGNVVPAMDRVSEAFARLARVMRKDRMIVEKKLDLVVDTMKENTRTVQTLAERSCPCATRKEVNGDA